MTRKHISEVDVCTGEIMGPCDCPKHHRDDFCLLCNYELEGDRLYMEIHGPTGWEDAVKEIDSAQPYVCMECAKGFTYRKPMTFKQPPIKLTSFIKEKKP